MESNLTVVEDERNVPAIVQPRALVHTDNQVYKASERVAMKQAETGVQLQFIKADARPRDVVACKAEILELCKDIEFASQAIYKVDVGGGATAEGFGIDAALDFINIWGNCEHGSIEHGGYDNESQVSSFCLDIEKNNKAVFSFTVSHKYKAKGEIRTQEDPARIAIMVKARKSKEERNMIMRIIPRYIQKAAIQQCRNTLHQAVANVPKAWQGACDMFAKEGVNEESLLRYVNKKDRSKLNAGDVVDLRLLIEGLKCGEAKIDTIFPERNKKVESSLTVAAQEKTTGKKSQAKSTLSESTEPKDQTEQPSLATADGAKTSQETANTGEKSEKEESVKPPSQLSPTSQNTDSSSSGGAVASEGTTQENTLQTGSPPQEQKSKLPAKKTVDLIDLEKF